MLELLVFGAVALAVALVALVVLPLLLVGLLLKALVALLLLPFRLIGAALGLLGLFAGLAFGLLVLAATAIALPLLPIVLLAGAIWLIVRALRPGAPRVPASRATVDIPHA